MSPTSPSAHDPSANGLPASCPSAAPYLSIRNALGALEFYKTVFGAIENYRLVMPDGRLGHAEIQFGDSIVMLADEYPEYGGKSPQSLGGSCVSLHLYVSDVDSVFAKAIVAGAKERKPVKDQFYGDRSGQLEDPFGHLWWIATHKEEVSPAEMQRRIDNLPT